ncbi:MAG: peptidoglycan DL-endopeptidase CwlO [Actinomycetota bacterium]|nr:peptidoglycan DL-endopeptidase CwlO [Actinomycetota bacterium]
MSTSMNEMNARIAQLQSLLGVRTVSSPSGVATGTRTSSTDFAQVLSEAMGTADTEPKPDTPAVGPKAVEIARGYSGVPYLWGGENPSKGLDCSGLVQVVYGKLGIKLPRVAADQARAGVKVPSLAQAQPGDLLFFGSPAHHVGIFVGDGKMIDAPRRGKTVGVHSLSGYGKISSIRRVSGDAANGTISTGRTNVLNLAAAELLSASGLSATAGSATSALTGPYAGLFTSAGRKHGVDPSLLSAIAKTESSYKPSAVSSAGARGLMQLMPGTARSLGVDPDDPTQAVDGAARLMKNLLAQFGGNIDLALAGYNAGPGAVRRYGGVPPYPETQTYVRRVNRAWEALR